MNSAKQEEIARDGVIFLKSGYKTVRVRLDEILYIEGVKDYVRLCLRGGRTLLSQVGIKAMEGTLPQPWFMRVHRSYICNMRNLELVDRMHLVYEGALIPVSETYKESVLDFLARHSA